MDVGKNLGSFHRSKCMLNLVSSGFLLKLRCKSKTKVEKLVYLVL